MLSACSTNKKEEKQDPIDETKLYEPSTEVSKQSIYYCNVIADKDGNMVIPLSADVGIICTDPYKASSMQKEFEELIVHYHQIFDPSHEFEGINNLKTINDNYGKDPVKVDKDLIVALQEAIQLSKDTLGYFNPSIGTLSAVWKDKFTAEHKNSDPDQKDIEDALSCVIPYEKLSDYIVIDETNCIVQFKELEGATSDVIIDLGAFSKGYVMDRAYEALLKYQSGFLITAGGSSIIVYKGEQQQNLSWTIGIKNPNTGSSIMQVKMSNGSISSSGDENQYFINEEGIRRHHILNPFTGYPENNYRNITIIAENNAGLLDGLTTAMYNLEDDKLDSVITNLETKNSIHIQKALIEEDANANLILFYDEDMKENIPYFDTINLKQITAITK